MPSSPLPRAVAALLLGRSDSRSAAILQGPRALIGFLALALLAAQLGARADARDLLSSQSSGVVVYEGAWGADAPIVISSDLGSASAEGLMLVGVYDYNDGRLYGCFDSTRRVLEGVWTQTRAATPCARAVGGERYWGRFEFAFSLDGREFEGAWTGCDAAERFWRSGWLQPSAIQAPDLRDPLAVLESLPNCAAPVS